MLKEPLPVADNFFDRLCRAPLPRVTSEETDEPPSAAGPIGRRPADRCTFWLRRSILAEAHNGADRRLHHRPCCIQEPILEPARHVHCHGDNAGDDPGTQTSSQGGATFAGGGFKPGIPDRRSFTPPCSVSGVPTFVELHSVTVGACQKVGLDGDWVCGLTDPNVAASVPANLKKIHIETGTNYRGAGGWSVPPGGQRIDVQGFVFWDPGHTSESWHFYSGWEIHNFTAWRVSAGLATPR